MDHSLSVILYKTIIMFSKLLVKIFTFPSAIYKWFLCSTCCPVLLIFKARRWTDYFLVNDGEEEELTLKCFSLTYPVTAMTCYSSPSYNQNPLIITCIHTHTVSLSHTHTLQHCTYIYQFFFQWVSFFYFLISWIPCFPLWFPQNQF